MNLSILGRISAVTIAVLSVSSIAIASPIGGPGPSPRRTVPTTSTPASVYSSSLPAAQFPKITGATISGSSHVIGISGNGMSLSSVSIGLPQQMESFSGITLQNKSGGNIPAQVNKQGDRLNISFDSPLKAGTSFDVRFNNVTMRTSGGESLPYQVSVVQAGSEGDISIGTALISVPVRN
ncbi:hypothetical protein [Synechococcus sp. PCC 6312]|uniref:hypothetical protein n=1 Tax=Synechococcus sp. (strain ATCC 27167 / PCC 6312) TaxID=195253 RepID=UPI00029EFDA6|nr:hypothetical protein [Synechococcus sp. PCC 6312]AFY59364.1 Protein of unknown function (DUF2808) [Synechococcus sp. PCC 6312]